MSSILIITGRLGKDPDMKYLDNGTAVTQFSVATDRKYKSGEEWVKEVTWFRVSVFGKMAETCKQYLQKGALVQVFGALTPDKQTGGPRVWTAQDGTAKASYEVRADKVDFLTGTKQAEKAAPDVGDGDNLPF